MEGATPVPELASRARMRVVAALFVLLLGVGPTSLWWLGMGSHRGLAPAPTPTFETVTEGVYAEELSEWLRESSRLTLAMRTWFLQSEWALGLFDTDSAFTETPGWFFAWESYVDEDGSEHDAEMEAFWTGVAERAERLGVRVHVLIAPDKARVYPEHAFPGGVMPTKRARLYERAVAAIRDAGVGAVEFLPELQQHKKDFPGIQLYARRDTHWNAAGAVLAARALVERIRGAGAALGAPFPFQLMMQEARQPVDLVDLVQGFPPGSTIGDMLRERRDYLFALMPDVGGGPATYVPVALDDAPVAVSGDSFAAIYFALLLMSELGHKVDRRHIECGSGPWVRLVKALDDVERGVLKAKDLVHVFVERSIVVSDWAPAGEAVRRGIR